jgi:hypothetical protein
MSSTIRLNEEDFWIFPDMTKFFNKANIVFAGFDRKSGLHTLVNASHRQLFRILINPLPEFDVEVDCPCVVSHDLFVIQLFYLPASWYSISTIRVLEFVLSNEITLQLGIVNLFPYLLSVINSLSFSSSTTFPICI